MFKDSAEFVQSNPLPCDTVKFTYQGYSDTTTPILIVYSFDKNIEKINYKDVVDSVISGMYMGQPTESPAPGASARRRRQSETPPPFCGVQELKIDTNPHVTGALAGVDVSDFSVLFPLDYEAGICGGECGAVIPDISPFNHAPFLASLLERESLNLKSQYMASHNYVFDHCCAPVSYAPLVVLAMVSQSTTILTVPHMQIHQCACLDIVKLS